MKIFNRSTIYRKRVHLRRFGIVRGRCFDAYHFGKRSLYIQTKHSRPVGFASIKETY
jgi:hypothetical protein